MKASFRLLAAAALLLGCLSGCQAQESPATDPAPEQTFAPLPTEPVIPAYDLCITEVMPDNKYVTLGHSRDWIELYNAETAAVELTGYYLTDDRNDPQALSLQGLTVPAQGYLVVALEEDSPFGLSADGETVYLIRGREAVDSLTYPACADGESFDRAGSCAQPSPGYPNTPEGCQAYLQAQPLPGLYISEVLSSNDRYEDPQGETYDLVELTNGSGQPLSLSGYTLTDKRSEPERYSFPEAELQPGESFVVYCAGDAGLGQAYAPFKISASGETVYLARDGAYVDALRVPGDLKKNESYGRDGSALAYFPEATPGSPNGLGYPKALAAPQADLPTGIYEEAVTVTLSGEGTIYYTTNGTRPTTRSKKYTEPITVKGVTTIRAFCATEDRSSVEASYTYAVGAAHDLPVVCVAIPQSSLTGDTGVLNHIESDFEHEAMLTLIEDGQEKFSVPFGFRLHGNDSRKGAKQNFQLRFRSEYGAGKLEYPLFADRDITEFDSLLLKGGSEDWYGSVFRDEMATTVANGTTALYTQATKPVVLYLGGEYWGIYYLRERFSDAYVASHLDVEPESVDLLYSNSAMVQSGSNADYKALKKYVKENDMTLPEHYAYLCSQIDVQSLMDWYICRSYMGDKDMANIRRFRSTQADGKWHWMYFDLDWSFWHTTDKPFTSLIKRNAGDRDLMQAVLKNPEGRDAFLKRYAYLMETVLNETYITAVIEAYVDAISSEIPADRAKWGQSVSGWEKAVQRLRDYVADGKRTRNVLADLKEYFSLTDEQMHTYFGALPEQG